MSDEKRGGPPSRGGGPGGGNRDRRQGGGNREGHPGGSREGRGGEGRGGEGRSEGGGERRGGGRRDRRGGGRKGGGFGKGPQKPVRKETYESLQELTRGEGFRIDKFVLAEKGTHKPVKVEYRLTREGLKGVHSFPRLVDAQAAATTPLPEPEAEVVEEAAVETTAETVEGEAAEGEAGGVERAGEEVPAERESVESVVENPAPEGADSVEHVANDEAAG
jgi:hypothetical protein